MLNPCKPIDFFRRPCYNTYTIKRKEVNAMTKSSYEVRAHRFIEQIFPYICDCFNTYKMEERVNLFNQDKKRKVKVYHGATRIAFITSDYCVKIDRPDEGDSYFGDCESEAAFYEYAKEEGYEYLFAKIEHYVYNDMNFYIMPRVSGVGHFAGDATDHVSFSERYFLLKHCRDLHKYNYGIYHGQITIIDYAASTIKESDCW